MTDRVAGPTKKMKCAVKQAGGSVQFCLGDLTRLRDFERRQFPLLSRRSIKAPAMAGAFSRKNPLVSRIRNVR